MAATQRITGAGERDPRARDARWRRLTLVLVLAGVVLGALAFHSITNRPGAQAVGDDVMCDSGGYRLSSIDHLWSDGPHTPADALAAFLSTGPAQGLPRSGYAARRSVTYESGAVLAPAHGSVYVHRTKGRIDVVLEVEGVGGVWQVDQARSCT